MPEPRSARQARFFGAELGRAERGEHRETDIPRVSLRRSLRKAGRKGLLRRKGRRMRRR